MKVYNFDQETEAGYQRYKKLIQSDSPLFQHIENELLDYLEGDRHLREMYESEEAIYTKRGAVIQAIDQIFEVMNEYNLTWIDSLDSRVDLYAAFQD